MVQRSEINPQKYSQLILTNKQKQSRANIVFTRNGARKSGYPYAKRKKNLDADFIFFTKTNSKQIIDMNVKHTTINLLEDG